MSIPARVHFCWIGARLPWAYVFAILSAAERGGLSEVILHHTDALEDCAELAALEAAHGVDAQPDRSGRFPERCGRQAGRRRPAGPALWPDRQPG